MIDLGALALMIPISAVVLGTGGIIIQSVMKSQERRIEMRLKAQKGQDGDAVRQIQALRAEIAALRDTTMQYDMTNDQIVQRLEERLSRVEIRAAARSASLPEDETVQRLGRG